MGVTITGTNELSEKLRAMAGPSLSGRVGPAVHRAMIPVANAIRRLIPVQRAKRRQKIATRIHFKSAVTIEDRTYKSGTVATIVGAPSGQQRHQYFVEDGTKVRYTNMKTVKRKARNGTITKVATYKKKDGTRAVRVYEKIQWKRWTESRLKMNKKPRQYRGKSPAFKPFERGVKSAQGQAIGIITAEVASIVEGMAVV